MMKKIVYNLFLVVIFILRKMPKFLRRAFFRFIATCGYLFAKKTNRIIKTNLDFIFGNTLSDLEIKEIQKSYREVGKKGFVETLRNGIPKLAKAGTEISEEGLKELFPGFLLTA